MGIAGAIGLLGLVYQKLGDYELMKACIGYAMHEAMPWGTGV